MSPDLIGWATSPSPDGQTSIEGKAPIGVEGASSARSAHTAQLAWAHGMA
jgi:hypothetical protein